jgi:DNA-binding transcriptional ArsR family regulator
MGVKMVVSTEKAAWCLAHPMRLRIVKALLEKRSTISQIIEVVGIDRSLTVYHMSYLQTYGLIESKYVLGEASGDKGKAVREYWCSIKLGEVVGWLSNEFKAISELFNKARDTKV